MFRDELMHFLRKMIDYEENELVSRYRLLEEGDVPKEDLEVITKLMDASVRHSTMLTELLAEITKEGKDDY